jgi:hypothetical protein
VIDATCPWRIAKELVARGYLDATSAHQLGRDGAKDPALLRWLRDNITDPYVLVTYDNNMSSQHAPVIRECQTTLAVIDKDGRPNTGLTEEQYWREVIHRHAHRFVEQAPATLLRYRCTNRPSTITLPPDAPSTVVVGAA